MEENKNLWRKFNPRLTDFIEKKPHLSLLGLWWALQWRITIFIWVVGFIIFIAFAFLGIAVFNS